MIDIHDFEGTIDVIENVLNTPDYYDQHISALLDARSRFLQKYHVFPQLVNVIKMLENEEPSITDEITLNPDKIGLSDIIFKIRCLSNKMLMTALR